MKKILLAASVALVVMLGAAPAYAAKDWHTVFSSHHTKVQSCIDKDDVVWFRVNNKQGKHAASFKERETLNGEWQGDGQIGYVSRHSMSQPIGGTMTSPAVVYHLKLKVYGFGWSKKNLQGSAIRAC